MVSQNKTGALGSKFGSLGVMKAYNGVSNAERHSLECRQPTNCHISGDHMLFVPRPPVVSFMDYEPQKVHTATVSLRNQDSIARRIKAVDPNCSIFGVRAKHGGVKVAPGMEAQFTVSFKPPACEDYSYDLKFCTDRDSFVVPVRALGARPQLQLPKILNFGQSCPCNSVTCKSLLARNTGRCAGTFQLSASAPYTVMPIVAVLDVGETVQCQVQLKPDRTGEIRGTLVAAASCGLAHTVSLVGAAIDADVSVGPMQVAFMDTFVTKTSQRSFRVFNNTCQAARFTLHRSQKHGASLSSADTTTLVAAGQQGLSVDPEFGTQEIRAFPQSGLVLPFSNIEVTVKYSPLVARQVVETCFVEVEGQALRQPVILTGTGLGPCAIFSYDVLDVGNIYVRTLYRYSVLMENRGDIPVPFCIEPGSGVFASMFQFSPKTGAVQVDGKMIIGVEIMPSQLGRFDERVPVSVAGTDSQLSIHFKGRVVGPACQINTTVLDFGLVSYGFRYTKELVIENTSEIPMPFSWQIDNGVRPAAEFNLIPSSGAVLPGGKQEILVEFISTNVCRYNAAFVLDMPKIQESVLRVEVTAQCAVPKLHISTDVLNFGDCPLDYPCTMVLVVSNLAKLPVKFVVDEQDPAGLALAEFVANPATGGISPQGEQAVHFTLQTKRLGNMQLPCHIQAVGSSLPPVEFVIAANSVGPMVTCHVNTSGIEEPEAVPFGRIPVMQSHSKCLCLKNTSLITAEVKAFISSKASVFSVSPRELLLGPGECGNLTVWVRLDETYSFSDVLQILVTNGNEIELPLTAVGVGSTLICEDISEQAIHFGPQIVSKSFSRSILVENHGRRGCDICWQNDALESVKKRLGRALRGTNGKTDLSLIPLSERVCFSVEPIKAIIPPKQARNFLVTGCLDHASNRAEMLRLLCGQEASSAKTMLSFTAVAEIDFPQITFSTKVLSFEYLYHPLLKCPPDAAIVDICNSSKTPINAALRTSPPFNVTPTAVQLQPGQVVKAEVNMNHAYRKDLVSHKPRKKLEVTFPDNPHVEYVELHGNINYPNVLLDKTAVTFDSAMNDTVSSQMLSVVNTCEVPVKYSWELISGKVVGIGMPDDTTVTYPAHGLFDVKPVEGLLEPGGSASVWISYVARANMKAHASAVMHVQGGPDTYVVLQAQASKSGFSLEPRLIKCGLCIYSQYVQKEITISNPSEVPFEWRYNGKSVARPIVHACIPAHGTVQPGGKQMVTLKIKAGLPQIMQQVICFEVAHFEPITIPVHIEGIYTSIALSLPRSSEGAWLQRVQRAHARLLSPGGSSMQRMLQKDMRYVKQVQDGQRASLLEQLDGMELYGHACMAAPGLTKLEVELEADRQGICDALIQKECMRDMQEEAHVIPHRMQPHLLSWNMMKFCKALSQYSMLPDVVASTYVLDFGQISKGKTACKTFRIQNASTTHAIVSVDTGLLEAFGCTLRPDKLPRLPGLPDRSCTEVQLLFNTLSPQIGPGVVEFRVPLNVQDGPPILVCVKAYVAIPELVCDQHELEFGRVAYGMGRVIIIRLRNPGTVPAEWCVKKPADGGEARDGTAFRCHPSAGVVAPQSYADVKVIFVPQQPGRTSTECRQDLSIKVDGGRSVMLQASGTSIMNKVQVAPKQLDLGVIVPGGPPAHGEIRLSNPGPNPIEVCAIDFDAQWAHEEQLLSAWNGYHKDWGFALLKPRGTGARLWDRITEDVQHGAQLSKNGTYHGPGDSAIQIAGASYVGPQACIQQSAESADDGTSLVSSSSPCASDPIKLWHGSQLPFFAIVTCIDTEIASQQAQLLAERYGVPVTSLDDLLLDAGELEHIDEGTGAVFGDMVYETLIGWDTGEDTAGHRPYASMPEEVRDRTVSMAFTAAIQQAKYAAGFVIMGTECEFSPMALTALIQATGSTLGPNSMHVLALWLDQEVAHQRYMDMLSEAEQVAASGRIEQQRNLNAQAALKKVKKVSTKKDLPTGTVMYPDGIDPVFGDCYAQYTSGVSLCVSCLGNAANCEAGGVRVIRINSAHLNPAQIHEQIIGLEFDMDNMKLGLPWVQGDLNRIPPPYDVQVVRKPRVRSLYGGCNRMLTLHPVDNAEHADCSAAASRWLLNPGESGVAKVQFASADVTNLVTRLAFTNVVSGAISEVTVRANCAYPRVNVDPLHVFPKTRRSAKPGMELRHCYVMQPGYFDFGCLHINTERPAPGELPDVQSIHTVDLKLQNDGNFVAEVKIDLDSLMSETAGTPPAGKPGKGKKAPSRVLSAFTVSPREMCIEVGETKQFTLMCYPTEEGHVQDMLRIAVVGNPAPSEFSVIAKGQHSIG
eukprot:jgi/Ulvmu1/4169/UM019_0148.1